LQKRFVSYTGSKCSNERVYSISHKCRACLLLFSFFLELCSDFLMLFGAKEHVARLEPSRSVWGLLILDSTCRLGHVCGIIRFLRVCLHRWDRTCELGRANTRLRRTYQVAASFVFHAILGQVKCRFYNTLHLTGTKRYIPQCCLATVTNFQEVKVWFCSPFLAFVSEKRFAFLKHSRGKNSTP